MWISPSVSLLTQRTKLTRQSYSSLATETFRHHHFPLRRHRRCHRRHRRRHRRRRRHSCSSMMHSRVE